MEAMSKLKHFSCKGQYVMYTITRNFFVMLLGVVVFGCLDGGSDDSFVDSGCTDSRCLSLAAASSVENLVIVASALEMKSDGSQTVTITATATDGNNVVVADAELELSASSGVLDASDTTTDASGQVIATLSTGNNSTERTISITASVRNESAGTTVDVVDTLGAAEVSQIGLVVSAEELSGSGSGSVTITAIVTDSQNIVVVGAGVDFSADSGALSITQDTTDSSGQALALLTAGGDATPRTITITATSGVVSTDIEVEVVDGVVVPTTGQLVLLTSVEQLGTDGTNPVTITAVLTDNNYVVVEGAEVIFTADSGALQVTNPTTDATGQADAILSTGGDPGKRTITVTATSGSLSDTITVDVVDAPGGSEIAFLDLLVSAPQLGSSAVDTIELTAIAKDENNVVTAGVEVAFAATSGSLQVTQSTTDAAGLALATLSTQGETANRTITVTASAGSLTATNTVDITGTSITISGESSVIFNTSTVLTIQLEDSDGNPISGILLNVSSSAGNTLTPTDGSFITDVSGEVQVTVDADVVGTDTITAIAEGATGTFSLVVSGDQFRFIAPTAGTEIDINGPDQTITVEWLDSLGPKVGQVVNFTATRGNLSATSSTTDANGLTTLPPITINSTNAGPSTITAFVTGGPSTTVEVEFIATVPAAVTLQADKSTIGPNDGSEAVEQKAILTATLRDANNNLVKGKTLRFSILQDTSGGTLTSATAVTDSLGQASVSYKSSAATTATDEVIIRVEVEENTLVNNTVNLTVAQKSLFVKLGTGNSIAEPNDAVYDFPYSVIVTDAGGNPVEGVLVTLKVSPTAYFKGWWWLNIDFWITRGGLDLTSTADPWFCKSEDLGSDNGILDPDEDENSNGVLDPGNVVAVPTTVTTDENGTGLFNLTYGQEFGLWTEVRLTASTEVNGTESIDTEIFTLTVAADDVNSSDSPPPGVRTADIPDNVAVDPDVTSNTRISPFGWSPACDTDDVNP